MGLLDIFKTQWSAGTMTEDDRKRIFWLLKRKTSYTAWKRVADRFDDFAAVFKKQVIEEPNPPQGAYTERLEAGINGQPFDAYFEGQSNWEADYPPIVKTQVLYEKALASLLQGDRSVFLYNERGLLGDAGIYPSDWHSKLVSHGRERDAYYDGKYVSELTRLIQLVSDARGDASSLQSQMAETPEIPWGDVSRPELLALPCIDPPEVTEPQKELLVRTGDEVPVFGIYEPQMKNGGLNYLLGGTPAPLIWGSDGHHAVMTKNKVTWRLIWEDTRYQEDHYVFGRIPPEEASYFPAEKPATVATAQPATVMGDMLISDTGQTCPKTGLWSIAERLDVTLSVDQGTEMPQFENRSVTWVYLRPRV